MRSDTEIQNLIKAIDSLENQLLVVSPDLEILAANAAARMAIGEDCIGRKCFDIFCKEGAPCDGCHIQQALQDTSGGSAEDPNEAGQRLALSCGQVTPIYDDGKLEAAVCVDIEPHKTTAVSGNTHLANAFLKTLIHSSPDAVIVTSPKGDILLINEAARKLSGYTEQEIYGDLNITDVYPGKNAYDVMARLRNEHYGGRGILKAYHVDVLNKQGQKIPIRLDAAIVYDGDKEIATLGYFRDLRYKAGGSTDTQQSGLEAEPIKDGSSLESIASSVAHRLNLYNKQFGQTAVKIGLIDNQQLDTALAHQEQLHTKTQVAVPLGRVLVKLDYITEEQRIAILAVKALSEEDRKDGGGGALADEAISLAKELEIYNQRFGYLALKLGFITDDQLARALQMQKQAGEKTKIDIPLGRVLEQLEYITEEQRAAVLAVQALGEDAQVENHAAELEAEIAAPEAEEAEPEAEIAEPEAEEAEPEAEEAEPEAEETELEAEEAEPEAEEPEPEAEEPETEAGGAEPEAGEAAPEAEEAAPEAEEAEPEAEEAEPEAEEAEPEAEEAEPDEKKTELQANDAEPDKEKAAPDGEKAEPEAEEAEPEQEKIGPKTKVAETEAEADEKDAEKTEPTAANAESGEEVNAGAALENNAEELENKIRDYFSVDISEDKLTARLLPKSREREGVVFADLLDLIETEGVRQGLIAEDTLKAFFADESGETEPLVIARGYPAGEGKDPVITYHFETEYLKAGKMLEDGTIDWKDRGEIPQVEEGDLLAEILPGVYGAVGMDVLGNEIPADPIAKVNLAAGKGVKKSSDGNSYTASAKGTPNLSDNQTLTVSPILQIEGDVGIETGHIEFDGHIEVEGTVQSGYQIRGTSLRAQGMHNAEIFISGDVVVTGGIFESVIKCQGNVKAVHIHKSDIDAGGDLTIEKEIIDSTVELQGSCQADYGTIISSKIAAHNGILAQNIGTAMSKPSHLDVGVDHKLRRELSGLKKMFAKTERKKKEITPKIKAARIESDQINGELGEVAQKQDQIMVQLRQMQDKFTAQEALDETVKAEYEKAVAELENRRSQIDDRVEELMEKDGELEKVIGELEEQETEIAEEQTELEERMEVLRQKRETEKGKPVVKVTGDLFAGNKITGPKSKITIEEDCRHVNIYETDKADDGQFARWHMKIGPLR